MPDGARDAFIKIVRDGPTSVEDLLGRGWWGRGTLPPPLDWLQRRALVEVREDGLVRPSDAAREGFLDNPLDLGAAAQAREAGTADAAARVEAAASVVVVSEPALLDRAISVPAAGLRAVAPTVGLSPHAPRTVEAALRGAGIPLEADVAIEADPATPTLSVGPEDAVGPRAIRDVLARAVREGRQVQLHYFASSRGGAATERTVDPWSFGDDLLVAHCHLRGGERTFALDRVGHARLLPTALVHRPPSVP